MFKQVISGSNAYLGAPTDWNAERDGECGGLAVRMALHADGKVAYCESAWEPSPAELAMLNAGGSVVLRVVGLQVPVAVYVQAAADPLVADQLGVAGSAQ